MAKPGKNMAACIFSKTRKSTGLFRNSGTRRIPKEQKRMSQSRQDAANIRIFDTCGPALDNCRSTSMPTTQNASASVAHGDAKIVDCWGPVGAQPQGRYRRGLKWIEMASV